VVGSLAAVQLTKVASNVVLARLLNPEVFGLAALAAVIGTALDMLSDLGIGASITQHPRGDEPRFLNTAWTLQVLRGLLIAALLALLAVPAARLYGDPLLAPVLLLLGGTVVLDGLASTSLSTFSRHLRTRPRCTLDVASQVLASTATILAAVVTPTIWAIVVGLYIRSLFRLLASHCLNDGAANRLCWDRESGRALLHFGGWVFVSTALSYFAGQADRLLLGRLDSLEVLGVYGLAATVAAMPGALGQNLAHMVLHPLFAKQAWADAALLGAKVLRCRRVVLSALALCTLTAMAGAPWFFGLLYDGRYAAAGWLTQILCVYMWFWDLQFSAVRAVLVLGDARPVALSNAVNLVVTVAGCVGGYWLGGLLGFAVGICLSSLAGHAVVEAALARRGIRLVRQDAAYTLLLLGLAAVGVLAPRLLAWQGGRGLGLLESLALGLPALAAAAAWLLWVLRQEVFKR
jgi:O-antigen/teichoic acid export membrane protein